MKNIKLIILSLLITSMFTSCYEDDLGEFPSVDPSATVVNVDATVSPDRTFTAEEDNLTFTVSIDQTFDTDATVLVRIDLDDARFVTQEVTIPAGQTSATGSIFLPADDGDDNSVFGPKVGFGSMSVTGIILDEPTPGTQYAISSNTVELDFFDSLPEVLDEGGISYIFTWETSPTDDYDIFSSITALNSATGNATESASVENDGFDDGDQILVYNPFAIAAEIDVPYTIIFRVSQADGSSEVVIFNGTLDAENSDPAATYPLVSFTRTSIGDGGDDDDDDVQLFEYSFEQLED